MRRGKAGQETNSINGSDEVPCFGEIEGVIYVQPMAGYVKR
jgi:hypothetical protein